jgi:hypothetical protein
MCDADLKGRVAGVWRPMPAGRIPVTDGTESWSIGERSLSAPLSSVDLPTEQSGKDPRNDDGACDALAESEGLCAEP